MTTPQDLLERWQAAWPGRGPIADELKGAYPDRWVRFHSLPRSQRYPDTAREYETVLRRYNTVLDELFAGQDVLVVTPDRNGSATPDPRPAEHARWHPGARLWTSIRTDDSEDAFTHLYTSVLPWRTGGLDPLLRAVADGDFGGVLVTDLSMRHVHHPYDGGADVLLADGTERDRMRDRHLDWLPVHPSGL